MILRHPVWSYVWIVYLCMPFSRQRATNYRALLRKMTYEDKASYDSSPSCMILCMDCVSMYAVFMYVCMRL